MLSPLKYSIFILATSIIIAHILYKVLLTSWVGLVIIMVFSSGMMALFIYVSSLTPNTKSTGKPLILLSPMLLMSFSPTTTSFKQSKQTMKMFSSLTLLVFMTLILILTMLAISLQSFNPQQSLASTY